MSQRVERCSLKGATYVPCERRRISGGRLLLGKSQTLSLHPKRMFSDVIRVADKVRSIREVALWCYNRTQTSLAQPTVFCYLFIIKARNFPIFCQFANLTFVRGLTSYFISVGDYF